MQKLELLDEFFPALMTGIKTNTLRWREGNIKKGYLLFYASKNPDLKAIVYVTSIIDGPLDKFSSKYSMSKEELYQSMLKHYPNIKRSSEVTFIEYLSPKETMENKSK